MPKKYNERSLIEFQKAFPDNEACAKHLAEQRWQNGYVCPHCGHGEAWYLQAYLSEVCYRFNRRYWEQELFDRLVQACVSTQTITHDELVHRG